MSRAGVVAGIAGPLLTLLSRSWRFEFRGGIDEWRVLTETNQPYVLLAWHEAMLPLLWHHRGRGMTIVVSEGREGRYLSRYAQRLGFRESRGSSSRGGVRAMLGAVKALRAGGSAAFTPDGPRGPRRVFKGGGVLAAQRAGAPVVPVHAHASRAWRIGSWDRLLVPKPFARVTIAYGKAFRVPAGDDELARGEGLATQELLEATRMAEDQ
jgi:lysophospholipid acyltransferase (LPLAT)-like uncharacterized protein